MTDRPARAAPRIRASPLELRLYCVALLAAVYVVAWRSMSAGAPPSVAPVLAVETATPVARVVWLDELPPAQRPVLALPPGWRLASRGELTVAPVVARAPASRPVRVRTRSS
jgi:hypothetical protein